MVITSLISRLNKKRVRTVKQINFERMRQRESNKKQFRFIIGELSPPHHSQSRELKSNEHSPRRAYRCLVHLSEL